MYVFLFDKQCTSAMMHGGQRHEGVEEGGGELWGRILCACGSSLAWKTSVCHTRWIYFLLVFAADVPLKLIVQTVQPKPLVLYGNCHHSQEH